MLNRLPRVMLNRLPLKRIAAILLFAFGSVCLPAYGQTFSNALQRVPAPTAAGQELYSGAYQGGFTWQTVSWYNTNGTQVAVGGSVDTGSRLSVNPQGTAENGLSVKMPSGTTGYGYALYSSTGGLLAGQTANGTGIFTGGQSQGTAIGATSSNALLGGTCIGYGSKTTAGTDTARPYGTAIGWGANATDGGTCIGYGSSALSQGIAIGFAVTAKANAVAIGGSATGNFAVALDGSTASGSQAFSVGYGAQASGTLSQAIGSSTQATGNGSIALGYSITAAANQFVVGANPGAYGISQTYIGDGVTNASPLNTTLNATGGSGTNIAGASLTLAGGQSTGTGAEGVVNLATSGSGATGTALNALTTRVTVSAAGLTVLGTGAVNSPAYQVGGTAGYTGTIPTTAQSFHFVSGVLVGYTNASGTLVGN